MKHDTVPWERYIHTNVKTLVTHSGVDQRIVDCFALNKVSIHTIHVLLLLCIHLSLRYFAELALVYSYLRVSSVTVPESKDADSKAHSRDQEKCIFKILRKPPRSHRAQLRETTSKSSTLNTLG
ncbi:unnamed protein product [Albugo candida]|uniref:Uncharacterized protein n=1 Tax=Albugo candida TaxID=65357 RepID=A0A024FSX7_9STRA|nr:unnamed protein product [Albugo candida]|eukprot:CCI10153.1 unnamed protein product [Albugo candida]